MDESGQAGIKKIASPTSSGASPYMTLGAAMVETDKLNRYRNYLEKVAGELKKDTLHCSQLNHFQKIHYAKRVASIPPLFCFGVISLKSTLRWYKEDIKNDSGSYYNKCAQLLLERVGEFMQENDILPHKLDVIFESGNFNYSSLRNLIKICQDTPKGVTSFQLKQIKLLRHINADNIYDKPKEEEPLLQLGDLIAHALYKCVQKSDHNMNITEPRYLRELKNKFYFDKTTSKIIGKGIKPVHKLKQLKLDQDILEFMETLANDESQSLS